MSAEWTFYNDSLMLQMLIQKILQFDSDYDYTGTAINASIYSSINSTSQYIS